MSYQIMSHSITIFMFQIRIYPHNLILSPISSIKTLDFHFQDTLPETNTYPYIYTSIYLYIKYNPLKINGVRIDASP